MPSSEEAFNTCTEETTSRIEEVFSGASYSSFASAAVICYIFNQILKHVHRTKPDDGRDDYDFGRYWHKHRELDNLLSSAFMFLPEQFRLPSSLRNPVAVHTNLNLHASIICLHNSAYEMTKEHDLPDHVRQTSKTRILTAAQEIVTIVKMTSHSNVGYKSPLVALALYVASSVYTTMSQDDGMQPAYTANLEFLLLAMNAIGKQHVITKSFLTQAIVDLQRAGILGLVRVPRMEMPEATKIVSACGNNIPLFARSRLSRIADIQPPLPGRLPLNNPANVQSMEKQIREVLQWDLEMPPGRRDGQETGYANKRKRIAISPEPTSAAQDFTPSLWFQPTQAAEATPSDTTTGGSSLSSASAEDKSPPAAGAGSAAAAQFRLPHRSGGGSSAGSSPSAAANSASTPTTQPSSGISPGTSGTGQSQHVSTAAVTMPGGVAQEMADPFAQQQQQQQQQQQEQVDMSFFQGLSAWDAAGDSSILFSQVAAAMQQQQQGGGGVGFGAALDDDSWMMIGDAGVGGGGAPPWDTGQGGTGGVG